MQEIRTEKGAIWNWKRVSLVHIISLGEGFNPLSRSGRWALQSHNTTFQCTVSPFLLKAWHWNCSNALLLIRGYVYQTRSKSEKLKVAWMFTCKAKILVSARQRHNSCIATCASQFACPVSVPILLQSWTEFHKCWAVFGEQNPDQLVYTIAITLLPFNVRIFCGCQ